MQQTPNPHTCAIRSVTVRVAGAMVTDAFAHHFGTSSQQVGVRAGDVLTYVSTRTVAAAIADGFAAAAASALRHRLRREVSATWLGVVPGTCPPALVVHLSEVPAVASGYQPQRHISGAAVPAHVWVRVDTVLWQVCDLIAVDALAKAWADCTRMRSGPDPRRRIRRAARPAQVDSTDTAPGSDRPVRRPAAAATSEPDARPAQDQSRDTPLRAGATARPPVDAASDPRGDADLLTAYVRGDRDALAVLVARRHGLVAHAVWRTVGPRSDRDDIAQTVWMQVASHADSFAGRAEVSTWLWRIARNTALTALRRDLDPVDPGTLAEQSDPHDPYRRHETGSVIEQLLTILPPDWRAATELVDLQGYDVDAAATLLDVPPGSVRSRRHRARLLMAREAARLGLTVDL